MSTAARKFRISYEVEGRTENRFVDTPEATIGRSPECDIVLPPETEGVSRSHAKFELRGNHWHIVDLGSRNHVFVNRTRVEDQQLKSGDEVNLGPFVVLFEDDLPMPANAPGAFNLAEVAGATIDSVAFEDDDEHRPNVSNSVNLASMSDIFREPIDHGLSEGPDFDQPSSPVSALDRGAGIRLFHAVGQALLSSHDLDDMLRRILTVVFDSVPARSGMIGLCDESGEVIPKVRESRQVGQLRISRSILNEAIRTQSALLVQDTAQFAHAASIKALEIQSALCVPLYDDGVVRGVIYVETDDERRPFNNAHLDVISALALFSAVAVTQAALRDDIEREQKRREGLSRYFSPAVVDQIVERSDSPDSSMLAEEREVTVLFADLKGFTAMSEKMEPAEVVHVINGIWERMNAVIFRHYGALDKFMGDGMMAFFGAPLRINNHAVAAVRAGLEMQAELAKFNANSGLKEIGMRIGVNTGPVVMGDIGSDSRKDFTVIGDTVNVASRLESTVARPGQVIIGPSTYAEVSELFPCESLEPIPLKGISKPLPTYLVHPIAPKETAEIEVKNNTE